MFSLFNLFGVTNLYTMMIILVYIYIFTTVEATPCKDNQHCASCMKSGKCSTECDNGFYGPKCNLNCGERCINNTCQVSDSGIGECTQGCELGFYGTRCNIPCANHMNTCKKCPKECEGRFCQLGSSCARRCQDSYYGTACKSCPAWCEVCNRVSGTCEVCLHCEGNCTHGCKEGCKAGFFGNFCEHSCSSKCPSECDQTSGDCLKCKSGWFGGSCDNRCPTGCFYEECDVNGICIHGCIEGWYGSRCESQCSLGCLDKGCYQNGICIHGCKKSWYGLNCEFTCQNGCKAGRCHKNGSCINGCREGLYGDQCSNKCPGACFNKLCDVEDGSCKSCGKGLYGGHCNKTCTMCVEGSCTQDAGHCIQGCLPNYREFCHHHCEGNSTSEECCVECKSESSKSSGIEKSNFIRYCVAGTVVLVVVMLLMYPAFRFSRKFIMRRCSAQNDGVSGQQQPLTENMSTDNRQPPDLCFQLNDVTDNPRDLFGTHPSVNKGSLLSQSHSLVNVENENETTLNSPEVFVAESYSHKQDVAATAERVPESSSERGYYTAISPRGDEEMYANCQAESGRQENDDDAHLNQRDSPDQDNKLHFEEIGILNDEEGLAYNINAHVYVNFRGMYQSVCR